MRGEYGNVPSRERVRNAPWHRLRRGRWVGEAKTIDEAIDLAELDWEVRVERPVFVRCGADVLEVPSSGATVRIGTPNVALAIVGSQYQPIQNREAFATLDGLIRQENLELMYAGDRDGGRQVWLATKSPRPLFVVDEDLDVYYQVISSHDGSWALHVTLFLLRKNGSSLGLPILKVLHTHTIKHTLNAQERAEDAAELMVDFREYFARFVQQAEELDRIRMSDLEFYRFVRLLYEFKSPRMEDVVAEAAGLFAEERPTRWGAYRAIVRWMENFNQLRNPHRRPEDELRAMRLLDGAYDKKKADAVKLLS